MDIIQKSRRIHIGLVLIIAILAVVTTGCTDSASGQQNEVTAVQEKQDEHAPGATSGTVKASPGPAKPVPPEQSPVTPLTNAAVTLNPVGEINAGDRILITGTTSLPSGTNLFWEIRPDSGTPPAGIDMNSRMGIMANNQVISGRSSSNTVSLSVEATDTKDLVAGKYVIVVVSLKGDPMTTDPSTGTLAGYGYLTLV